MLRSPALLSLTFLFVFSRAAVAATFFPGTVDCSLGNGHCYQVVLIGGNAGAPFTWAEADAFARAQVYQGNPGHLLTLETQAEFDAAAVPKAGYLGAEGPSNGPYVWTNGVQAGAPVSYFAPFTAGPIAGSDPACGPFPRLCVSASGYYGGPATAKLPSPLPGCPCEQSFVVEYEPDVVPPRVTVLVPNGGETVRVSDGSSTGFSWLASDDIAVAGVDLFLSRSGPDGPWETMATNLPNTGNYTWAGNGPAAAGTAYFRVRARDEVGNTAEDESDEAFSLLPSVPALPTTWGRLKTIYR